MKRAFIVLYILTNFYAVSRAQLAESTIEKLMTKRVISCADIYYNVLTLVPELYNEGKTDTLNAIIDYAHRNCDIYSATVAYLLLHSIETHTFSESITNNCKYYNPGSRLDSQTGKVYYEKNIIGFLNAYIIGAEKSREGTQYAGDNIQFPAVNKDYIHFIEKMALSLSKRSDLMPAERFIVELYAHPDFRKFADLKTKQYKGTLLQKAYNVNAGDGGVEYTVFAGRWQPFGKLALLGDHPMVGCFIGSRENKTALGITFSVSFNKSPVMYDVKKNGSIFATDRFVQYYIGYDFAQALYSLKKTEFTVNTGIGYDGINALTKNDKHESRTIGSLNWNLGLGMKIFLKHRENEEGTHHSYIGLQAKYNLVNYSNSGGTDLSGQSACLVLTFGGFQVNRATHYETFRQAVRFRWWG